MIDCDTWLQPEEILVSDRDRQYCERLAENLAPYGYKVRCAYNGKISAHIGGREHWQAIVIDMKQAYIEGYEAIRDICRTSDVPVIILSADSEEADRIVSLEMGADDYLSKDISIRELVAKLRAVTRRIKKCQGDPGKTAGDQIIRNGTLIINPATRQVRVKGSIIKLTPVEFDVLFYLARFVGKVVSRDQLLDNIRNRSYEIFDRSIDVHISGLRKKLGDSARQPNFIRTVRTAGYLLIDNSVRDEQVKTFSEYLPDQLSNTGI